MVKTRREKNLPLTTRTPRTCCPLSKYRFVLVCEVRGLLFLFIFIFVCFNLSAQTINLEQAREMGLANSKSLKKYEMAIKSSVLDEKNQLYSMLPQVSADYRASSHYMRNWELVSPIDTFTTGASISITQIIFQGGKSFVQRAISKIATESVRIDAQVEYFKVIDEIDSTYFAVLEASAAMKAEEVTLKAADLGLAIAQVRRESGMINQGDYLKALADKESRENSFNQARRGLALNMTRFKTLTGIKNTPELEQIDFTSYEEALSRLSGISDEDAEVLFESFWKIITKNSPALSKAALNNQRAEKSHTLVIRDLAPTIRATIFSADVNFMAPDRLSSANQGGVSITGSIPVDFWVFANRLEKSKLTLESASIDYENSVNSIEQELRSALSSSFSQAGTVLSSRNSLEYTEKHFEFVMERYRLSQSSVSDLTEATSLFINSQNNLNRASYSFLQSLSKLRSLCAFEDESELIKILTE